jgi:hypothetical protein
MEIIAEELHENYHLYPLDRTIDRTELISARILGEGKHAKRFSFIYC